MILLGRESGVRRQESEVGQRHSLFAIHAASGSTEDENTLIQAFTILTPDSCLLYSDGIFFQS